MAARSFFTLLITSVSLVLAGSASFTLVSRSIEAGQQQKITLGVLVAAQALAGSVILAKRVNEHAALMGSMGFLILQFGTVLATYHS